MVPLRLRNRDFRMGRGGGSNNRTANRELRARIKTHKQAYRELDRQEKGSAKVVLEFKESILKQWKDEDRKFIQKNPDGTYSEVDDKRAIEAIRQKLTEKDKSPTKPPSNDAPANVAIIPSVTTGKRRFGSSELVRLAETDESKAHHTEMVPPPQGTVANIPAPACKKRMIDIGEAAPPDDSLFESLFSEVSQLSPAEIQQMHLEW